MGLSSPKLNIRKTFLYKRIKYLLICIRDNVIIIYIIYIVYQHIQLSFIYPNITNYLGMTEKYIQPNRCQSEPRTCSFNSSILAANSSLLSCNVPQKEFSQLSHIWRKSEKGRFSSNQATSSNYLE